MRKSLALRQLQARPVARTTSAVMMAPTNVARSPMPDLHLAKQFEAGRQIEPLGCGLQQIGGDLDKSRIGVPEINFEDTQTAFRSKTTGQLLRNYLVLGLCSSKLLVENNERLMKLSRKVLGKQLFELAMRSTFYGQFVAGADELEIEPVIKHLAAFGVKAILDYSAEEDVSASAGANHDQASSSSEAQYLSGESSMRQYQQSSAEERRYVPLARTYFYRGESQCERNLEIFFRSIEAVATATGNTGFAAIKLTALGRPQLLMKLSKIIDYMSQLEMAEPQLPAANGEPESLEGMLSRFEKLPQTDIEPLDEDELEMLNNLMRRLHRLSSFASQVGGARCMIDAEQTYMQPAINRIAMELMRVYNRREPIIFNTYQCYLKGAFAQVRRDLEASRRENFFFGAKLVRGAYMDQERARAASLGYQDPINESFEATTAMYQRTLLYLMEEIARDLELEAGAEGRGLGSARRISIMCASHNEDTIRFALQQMDRLGIKPQHRVICFGQLLGMCDHVSFMLGQAGYSVYKYTPYGPVEEVLPYLGRRALENHGFLGKLQRERGLLSKEILDRLSGMRWFYKPTGNYKPV